MSAFDLDALVRSALDETPDPREMWAKVRADLDAETVWLAIDAMGPDFCRKVAGQKRGNSLSSLRANSGSESRPGRPRKADAFDARWVKAMDAAMPLSDDGKLTKRLGDCAPHEVLRAAAIRRKNEQANRVWAERFEALAEKMRIYRASTVSALEPSYFWEAMA